jgi:hypothetical protein
MAKSSSGTARPSGFQRAFDALNAKLFPWLGPPPLGPYDQEPERPVAHQLCPLCGQAMALHEIDRSGERTQLYCPQG